MPESEPVQISVKTKSENKSSDLNTIYVFTTISALPTEFALFSSHVQSGAFVLIRLGATDRCGSSICLVAPLRLVYMTHMLLSVLIPKLFASRYRHTVLLNVVLKAVFSFFLFSEGGRKAKTTPLTEREMIWVEDNGEEE